MSERLPQNNQNDLDNSVDGCFRQMLLMGSGQCRVKPFLPSAMEIMLLD